MFLLRRVTDGPGGRDGDGEGEGAAVFEGDVGGELLAGVELGGGRWRRARREDGRVVGLGGVRSLRSESGGRGEGEVGEGELRT